MDLGAPELLVILLIVVVLFGTSRIATIGKDLGTAIREFRRGFKDDPQPAPASGPAPIVAESPGPAEPKSQ